MGDYGSGKTQLKLQIQTAAENRASGFLVITSANLQETSLKGFCENFVKKLKQLISRDHGEIYPSFQPLFEQYNKKLSLNENIRIVTQLIKIGASNDLKFLLQFDEIDQISDTNVFQPWASLFVALSDQIDVGLLGIVYIAEREITRLWRKDLRLGRFQDYLMERMSPGNRFGEKYLEGMANVLSLYEIANNHNLDPKSIELLERFLGLHKERMKRFSLREFNIAAYRLCRTLHIFEKNTVWQKVTKISRGDRTQIGQKAEQSLIQLISGIQLHFDVEGERYSAELLSERVSMSGWQSDGKLEVQKEIEGEYLPHFELPIEIKYTTRGNHGDTQIKKVERMANTRPTIFFSIGVIERNLDRLHKRFENLCNNTQLLVIDVDRELFNPIFVNTEGASYQLRRSLQEWFQVTSKLNQLFVPFLEALTKRKLIRKIEELQAEIERVSATTPTGLTEAGTMETSGVVAGTTQLAGSYEVATVVVTLFEEVSNRKSKSSLPKHVLNALPAPINDFDQVLSGVLNQMVEKEFLRETAKNYTKTNSWTRQALIHFCKEFKEKA